MYLYTHTCAGARTYTYAYYIYARAARAMHNILRPQSSFTRYLAFPLLSFPLPAPRPVLFRTLQQRCTVLVHVCALYVCAHMYLCSSEPCARLVAVPCRCMQILSSNLVSARASVLRGRGNGEGWEGGERGRAGEPEEDDKLWIESWNCYETAQTSAKLWLPRY